MALRSRKDIRKDMKKNIAKKMMGRKNPVKQQLPSMITGLVGGALAGLGVSFLVNRGQGRMASSMGRADSGFQSGSTTPGSRASQASRGRSKQAGSNLGSSGIQTEEQKSSGNPSSNDSLGG